MPCAKTKREEEKQKPCFRVASHFILPLQFHYLFHALPPLVPLPTPITPPLSCVLPLTYTCPDTHSYIHTQRGETWLAEEAKAGSKAMCGEGARAPRRKQLPLAVSASHPSLTAARNMRPLQTSVLGKKDRTAHIHSEMLLSLLPLTLPRSP